MGKVQRSYLFVPLRDQCFLKAPSDIVDDCPVWHPISNLILQMGLYQDVKSEPAYI